MSLRITSETDESKGSNLTNSHTTQTLDTTDSITRLGELLYGYVTTQVIHIAARLRIPDLIGGDSITVDEAARQTGAMAEELRVVMEALAALGVLVQDEARNFRLTSMGELLRTGEPMHAIALAVGDLPYRALIAFSNQVKTGEHAFRRVFGDEFFGYLSGHPDSRKPFDDMWREIGSIRLRAITGLYDFAGVRRLVDVGGGHGQLCSILLPTNPLIEAEVFDLPEVESRATEAISAAGLSDRCKFVAGNFFDSVPAGADVYTVANVIVNWDHVNALRILTNCRKAAGSEATLLLVDGLRPSDGSVRPLFPSLVGIYSRSLFSTDGSRTIEEYRHLLDSAGFYVEQVRAVGNGAFFVAKPRQQ